MNTTHSIKMPDIGEGIAEVELVAWHVKVGDTVHEDQILADVMTDKATVEIPSDVTGTVVSLDAQVGQVVAVGTPIIHIKNMPAALDGQALTAIKHAALKEPEAVPDPVAAVASAGAVPGAAAPSASVPPPAFQLARANPVAAVGRASVASTASLAMPTQRADRPIASPAVRRRAWELGIDLAQVPASGPTGRISHADLAAQVAKHSTINSYSRSQDKGYSPIEEQETIPVMGLRRKIAQKMQEAKRRIPHFTYVEEIDVTELEALRAQLNAQHGDSRGRLTLLPLLIRAMVLAVRQHPQVNARYDDDAAVVTRFGAVHLGLATQTDAGLMVPVIRHAESLDLWACAGEIRRLSDAARSGKATREELGGSTITLTSLGALGGIVSTPVINHPEVAIVGTNRMVERPVLRGGAVVARKMMNLSSSFDHRVVDGLHAAEFIQRMRALLECPGMLFVP
ncbi:MAG: 2-oxo acid dehydrogenase subunit E2 [Rhodoferax sp.]|jgi:2-oxoisovalerate dehydrogenase E2 component (dihydrolipoyl transacylase)|nr:2-oxo acid dehydrogenase subunit E2 [Rhodoferax sp.]